MHSTKLIDSINLEEVSDKLEKICIQFCHVSNKTFAINVFYKNIKEIGRDKNKRRVVVITQIGPTIRSTDIE